MQTDSGTPATRVTEWHKSIQSNPSGDCVQVARLSDGQTVVRNSRRPSGETLVFTRAEMTAFLAGAKDGEFDYLLD